MLYALYDFFFQKSFNINKTNFYIFNISVKTKKLLIDE